MTTTPRFGFDYIEPGTSAEPVYNETLGSIETMLAPSILDRDLTAPPGGESEGDAYIVAATATGAWLGHEDDIAVYIEGQWRFITPYNGLRAWIIDEDNAVVWVTSLWKTLTGESILAMRQTAASSNFAAAAALTWNTEIRKDGRYTHSTSVNTDQITLVEAGDYEVAVTVLVEQTATAAYTESEIELTVNGTAVTGTKAAGFTHFGNINRMTLSLTTVINVAAGDILRVTAAKIAGTGTVRAEANGARIVVRRV